MIKEKTTSLILISEEKEMSKFSVQAFARNKSNAILASHRKSKRSILAAYNLTMIPFTRKARYEISARSGAS